MHKDASQPAEHTHTRTRPRGEGRGPSQAKPSQAAQRRKNQKEPLDLHPQYSTVRHSQTGTPHTHTHPQADLISYRTAHPIDKSQQQSANQHCWLSVRLRKGSGFRIRLDHLSVIRQSLAVVRSTLALVSLSLSPSIPPPLLFPFHHALTAQSQSYHTHIPLILERPQLTTSTQRVTTLTNPTCSMTVTTQTRHTPPTPPQEQHTRPYLPHHHSILSITASAG